MDLLTHSPVANSLNQCIVWNGCGVGGCHASQEKHHPVLGRLNRLRISCSGIRRPAWRGGRWRCGTRLLSQCDRHEKSRSERQLDENARAVVDRPIHRKETSEQQKSMARVSSSQGSQKYRSPCGAKLHSRRPGLDRTSPCYLASFCHDFIAPLRLPKGIISRFPSIALNF